MTDAKTILRPILLLLLLSKYTFICHLTNLCHNQEPDWNFHENCPACQWGFQNQEDEIFISVASDAVFDPLVLIGKIPVIQSVAFAKLDFQAANLSRAPPSIS